MTGGGRDDGFGSESDGLWGGFLDELGTGLSIYSMK